MDPPAVNDIRDCTSEATEVEEALAAARLSTPTMVERLKSARQARKLLFMRIFAWSSSSMVVR